MSGTAAGPAFITGGSSGIGLELARQLRACGREVVIFARDANRLSSAVQALGEGVHAVTCDVADPAAVDTAVAQAIAAHGAPAWAIANAGIALPGEFLTQPAEEHAASMAVNYMGALQFARACTPQMAPGARLVFVASGAAFFGIYGYSSYAPSKFAMRGLAEVLRVELAPRGISVTLAYPPDTDTPMLAAEEARKPAPTRAITKGGGLFSAEDVARLILKRAEKGRFAATPGWQMTALLPLHSLIAPLLRRWQAGIVARTPGLTAA